MLLGLLLLISAKAHLDGTTPRPDYYWHFNAPGPRTQQFFAPRRLSAQLWPLAATTTCTMYLANILAGLLLHLGLVSAQLSGPFAPITTEPFTSGTPPVITE